SENNDVVRMGRPTKGNGVTSGLGIDQVCARSVPRGPMMMRERQRSAAANGGSSHQLSKFGSMLFGSNQHDMTSFHQAGADGRLQSEIQCSSGCADHHAHSDDLENEGTA